jgi:hypothetical protein
MRNAGDLLSIVKAKSLFCEINTHGNASARLLLAALAVLRRPASAAHTKFVTPR